MSTQSKAFETVYDLAFQVSPIILVGGIASGTLDGMMPLLDILGAGLVNGLLSGSASASDFPAVFLPIPGGTLIANQIGEYPFANQTVAANAVIQDPLNISLEMIAPVKSTAGYMTKTVFYLALQKTFESHNAAGGLYHVMTPAFPYFNCVMVGMSDITDNGDEKQRQIRWQLDFRKPLVTKQQASKTLSAAMSKFSSGQKVTPTTAVAPASISP